ncbi:hypothetical protein Adt_14392 [Abeliophyllum distichum]|uniref:Uncharacterized protein n=1 Tax=Abeliophyllum distichum TaxID=126358 RepID=A0ABD1TZI5_9LAMI
MHGLVLTKEVYDTVEGFDGKLAKEEANSKKLSEELKAMSLDKAQLEIHKRATEATQKSVEEAQKLAEERAFATETTLVTVNSALKALAAENGRLLAEARKKIERIKVDCTEVEAKAVVVYQEGFKDTLEYQDLAHHCMTEGREQLAERIGEVHPEWDLSFLRHPPGGASTFAEPSVSDEALVVSKALGPVSPSQVGS